MITAVGRIGDGNTSCMALLAILAGVLLIAYIHRKGRS